LKHLTKLLSSTIMNYSPEPCRHFHLTVSFNKVDLVTYRRITYNSYTGHSPKRESSFTMSYHIKMSNMSVSNDCNIRRSAML